MIFSQLHFINLSIDVAEKFKNFEVKDFDALRLKIVEIRRVLQKNESITDVEVILKLSFQESEKQENSKALNALIKEFAQKTPVIFKIEIISPQLDIPYYAALQAAFDEAYIQSLKTWHAQTFLNEQAVVTIGDLMLTQSSHNLAIMTQDREDLSEPRLDSVFSKRPNRPMRYNQVVQSSLRTSPHLQSHSATLAAFSNILPALEAFGGEAGIINLCDLVKNHPQETIERFSQLFLSASSTNIQDIMSPSGLKQLKICFNDWSLWFFKYFLNLTQQHSDPAPPRLETFIEKMQELWCAIEDFPLLQTEKNLDYPFDFFQRINHMLRLIEKTAQVWKKSQIEWMFALDWQKRDDIDKFLTTDKCQWVHPKMFDADHRVQQFYIDAAKLMKSASIETLDSYIDHLNGHPANDQKFRLLAWFLSLEPAPRLAELKDIIPWFEQQTVADRESIVHFCHAELIQGRINFDDFKDCFHLAIKKDCKLLPLLKLQHRWHTYPELQDSQWTSIFELLKHQDEPTSLIEKSTFSNDVNFRIAYFSTMLRLIFNDADDMLDDLIASFETYTPDKQDLIINILRSLNLEQELTKPSARALLEHLSAHARESQANVLQQNLWQEAYPSLNFLYFASNINYEQIIDSLADICQNLIVGIDKILATTIPSTWMTVKTLLQESMLIELSSQQAALRLIEAGLNGLKTSGKQQVDIPFQGLDAIETTFDVFFNRTLGEAFGPLLLRLLPTLHASLNKDSSIKDLLSVINQHHAKLPQAFKDIFPPKILADLQMVSDGQSIVAMMMQKQLVAPTRDILHAHLDKNLHCHERIQEFKLAPLAFLGTIELSTTGIGHFFSRLNSVTAITSQWPKIEKKCEQYNESPLEIWQLCIKHQQGAMISSYWRACFDILEHLFKHHHHLETLGNKRFIKLFELLLKQKNSFPEGLSANGEISHHSWQVFLKFLDKSLSIDVYSHPAFTCLFPIGIQSTLSNGPEFKFAEMSRIFAELSELDSHFLPILIANLQHPNKHTQENTEQLIQKLGPIFKTCEAGPYLDLLRIMLTRKHLENHLEDILKILDCIKNHPEFDLLGIILSDKSRFDDSFITQLSGFVDVFLDLPAPWASTYQKTFFPQEPTAEKIDVPTMHEYAWWQPARYWRSKPSAPIPPTVPKEQEVPNFWPIITLAPYPRIEQLSSWLKSPPEESRLKIEAFDVSPTDEPKPIPTPSDADFSRWIQELECYDRKWSRDQKFTIAARLKKVWTLGNYFCAESRTSLIKKFHTHRDQLLAGTTQDQIELENTLIGILAAIYQKIDQKMPYPTQLLALLMVLEYGSNHLIAEVDTSEGKATIIAILAILKWSRRNENTVLVYTHTPDLVAQDFYQKKHLFLFRLLNIRANPIEADSPLTSLQTNGIYYTTQDDMRVFREKQRLQGIDTDFPIDVIVDEVDEFLDQTTKINLVKVNPITRDIPWIYAQINQFIANYLANPETKRTPNSWGLMLKQFILEQNTAFERTRKLKSIPHHQWLNWIKAGLYVQNLKENVDFIIQELEAENGRLYTTVPYVKSAPKAGYQLAYLSLAGIPQLLHAKLATRDRCFKMEDETSIITELPSVDFRNAGNLTGFSGSIGGVREVRSLQQMFRAIPIRIGRYHLKKLEEQPSLLLPNQRKLHEKILELLVANDQPILIVSRKIEDAQAIYDYLNEQQKGSLANKHLKCITGQESETSRQRWLYNKSGIGHSAGNEHCVTIATQICGRGTDIHVTHDKGLLVILTDVLDSRNLCQNKGRAARAGHPGSFIALYNAAQLQREWGHLNLPRLAQETISTWITQIQKEMLFVNSRERLRFSGEAWYHHHLSHFLAKALRNNPPATIKNAQKKLRALLESKSTHDAQFESHKRIATEIWDELLSYLVVLGIELVSEHFGAEAFKKSLSSSEQWQTIVSPSDGDTFFRNHAKGIPAPTIDDAPQSKPKSNHEQKLLELRKRLQSMPLLNHKQTHWYDGVINWFFNRLAWFNPSSQKLKQALAQDWDTFNTTPSFENWSVFYSTLLSAEYLQKKQAESWIWRIDYWFKLWNPLGPWCEFKNNAEKEFNLLFTEAKKDAVRIGDVIGVVGDKIKSEYPVLLRPFSEKKEGLVFNIMGRIYPETYEILNKTYQAWHVLEKRPTTNNKNAFGLQLTTLNEFYQTHYANSFWPFSYWKDYFQLWKSVYSDFKKTTIETRQLPKDLIEWQAETQAKSHKRLLYLGHLMCQEQIHTYDFRFYCNFFGSSGFLSKMQEQYESTHNNGDLELKIDELSRYFPQQLKIIFKQLHPDFEITDTDRDVIKKLCHEILQRYVLRPEDGVKISIPLIDKKCQVLLAELEQWQESRELIPYHCL